MQKNQYSSAKILFKEEFRRLIQLMALFEIYTRKL
jgi:hypothetical protein